MVIMKNTIIILLSALPFSWLASIVLSLLNQLGLGFWLIENLSISGYWPVNIVFYIESFLSALLVVAPYVLVILWLVPANKYGNVITAILAYVLFTFLLCFQKEHLTACLFTLVQSSHIAVYLAIFILFEISLKFLPKGRVCSY